MGATTPKKESMYNDQQDTGIQPGHMRGLQEAQRELSQVESIAGTSSSESPVFQALARLSNAIERNAKKSAMLQQQLSPILDLSPRPENSGTANKLVEPGKKNIVEIIHYLADKVEQNIDNLNEISGRVQV